MIGNNLKIAWRNMANNKLYSIIKIGGFAFSIAICILIVLYIRHETSYDKMYPDMDRVFRLIVSAPDGDKSILEIFPLPVVQGQLSHALDKPNAIVIPKVGLRNISKEML